MIEKPKIFTVCTQNKTLLKRAGHPSLNLNLIAYIRYCTMVYMKAKIMILLILAACGKTQSSHTSCYSNNANGTPYKLYFAYDSKDSACAVYDNGELVSYSIGDGVNCGVLFAEDGGFVSYVADRSHVLVDSNGISSGESFESCEELPKSVSQILEDL